MVNPLEHASAPLTAAGRTICLAARSLNQFEVSRLPALVEPGLQWCVEPKDRVPTFSRYSLDPVGFLTGGRLRREPHGYRTVAVLLDTGLVTIEASQLLVGLEQRAGLVVINRKRPELSGGDRRGQREFVGLAAVEVTALRVARRNRVC